MSISVPEILEDCRLLSAVTPRSFQRLVAMARLVRFAKGERIFDEGEPCPGFYAIGSGLIRIFKLGPGGKEHVLHIVGPGDTFAEVAAIGKFDLPASAEAIDPAVCALVPMEPFRQALESDHRLCLEMMAGMAGWVKHLVGLMEDVVLRDAAGRIARFLLETQVGPDGAIALPGLKRHVASHLNLTSETLSRMLRRLADAQLIALPDATHIRLLDPARLRQVAQGLFPNV